MADPPVTGSGSQQPPPSNPEWHIEDASGKHRRDICLKIRAEPVIKPLDRAHWRARALALEHPRCAQVILAAWPADLGITVTEHLLLDLLILLRDLVETNFGDAWIYVRKELGLWLLDLKEALSDLRFAAKLSRGNKPLMFYSSQPETDACRVSDAALRELHRYLSHVPAIINNKNRRLGHFKIEGELWDENTLLESYFDRRIRPTLRMLIPDLDWPPEQDVSEQEDTRQHDSQQQ